MQANVHNNCHRQLPDGNLKELSDVDVFLGHSLVYGGKHTVTLKGKKVKDPIRDCVYDKDSLRKAALLL
jgi:hypothetical protein